jgi:hypothetical protein
MVSSGAVGGGGDAFRSHLSHRARFIGVIGAVAVLTTFAVAVRDDRDAPVKTTVQLMVHPDSGARARDVPNAVRVLDAAGPFVGTVAGVFDNGALLSNAAARAGASADGLSVGARVLGGSDVIEWTVAGHDRATVAAIGAEFPRVAHDYVSRTYPGFAIDVLSSDTATARTAPLRAAPAALALLFASAIALALIVTEFRATRRLTEMLRAQ